MKSVYSVTLLLLCTFYLSAQYQIGLVPRKSADKGVYEKIGYTGVNITYGSPSVKGRNIWGNIVPYQKVWRAGANNATTIEFSEDVELNGKPLQHGIYALFIIPEKDDHWTVIFNRDHDQWGSFDYDNTKDALRIKVLPVSKPFQEHLSYNIESRGFETGHIYMDWENIRVGIEVKTNYLNILKREIQEKADKATDTKWVVYLQGADYLLQQNKYLDQAMIWIDQAEDLYTDQGDWHPQYYPREYLLGHVYWTKAKISALQNEYATATKYYIQLTKIKGDFTYYNEENEFEGIDNIASDWSKK